MSADRYNKTAKKEANRPIVRRIEYVISGLVLYTLAAFLLLNAFGSELLPWFSHTTKKFPLVVAIPLGIMGASFGALGLEYHYIAIVASNRFLDYDKGPLELIAGCMVFFPLLIIGSPVLIYIIIVYANEKALPDIAFLNKHENISQITCVLFVLVISSALFMIEQATERMLDCTHKNSSSTLV